MIDKNRRGFTLIELMIVVAVVGILAAIGYPSYVDSVRKARRSDGTAALMNAAQRMEVFYAKNATYTSTLADANIPATSEEGYFNISIPAANAGSYTLRATAVGDQANDDIKGFQLTSTGAKTHTLDGTNWTTAGWND
ncbi:MAG TPA: type IV pilin protein [Chromatiaceae bacterium]|nr:type IV pilin protein [Chromatiaceae bacterium]